RNGTGITTQSVIAGSGFSVGASDSWQQNWNVAPVSDANTLRNLRALYRYVVYGTLQGYHTPRVLAKGELVPNNYYRKMPHFVKCGPDEHINEKLQPGWLYWTNDIGVPGPERLPPPGAAMVTLGHFGNHTLFMRQDHFQA